MAQVVYRLCNTVSAVVDQEGGCKPQPSVMMATVTTIPPRETVDVEQ
jgi:hypothetical protein